MDPSELTIEDMPSTDEMHHIYFDVIGCDTETSLDEDFVYSLMMEVPSLIDMRVMMGPYIETREDDHKWGRRVTGVTVIDHSHMTYHAFEDKPMVMIDVFSIESFDESIVHEYLQGRFDVRDDQIGSGPVLYEHERR